MRSSARDGVHAGQKPRPQKFLIEIAVGIRVAVSRIAMHQPMGALAEWLAVAGNLGVVDSS